MAISVDQKHVSMTMVLSLLLAMDEVMFIYFLPLIFSQILHKMLNNTPVHNVIILVYNKYYSILSLVPFYFCASTKALEITVVNSEDYC